MDRFHSENTYVICLRESHLNGMICIRETRPFSLDTKFGNVDGEFFRLTGLFANCDCWRWRGRTDILEFLWGSF